MKEGQRERLRLRLSIASSLSVFFQPLKYTTIFPDKCVMTDPPGDSDRFVGDIPASDGTVPAPHGRHRARAGGNYPLLPSMDERQARPHRPSDAGA